jgi:hypothetical protein
LYDMSIEAPDHLDHQLEGGIDQLAGIFRI